jgi:hypothetical protein
MNHEDIDTLLDDNISEISSICSNENKILHDKEVLSQIVKDIKILNNKFDKINTSFTKMKNTANNIDNNLITLILEFFCFMTIMISIIYLFLTGKTTCENII